MDTISANFFPFPEKLRRDYRGTYDEVMKSIRNKSSWKPFNHVNPIVKGGLANFYPSLQANYDKNISNTNESRLPGFDIPTNWGESQQPISTEATAATAAKPEDPYWEFQMDNVIHQIGKEIPEKVHFKDAFSHKVLPELTSSVPLYEKGENYYDSDRPIKQASGEMMDQAKVFNNFEKSLSQIATGNIPKLHHIENNNNNNYMQQQSQFEMGSKPKLSKEEIGDLLREIKIMGMDLEWRCCFAGVMRQLVSHVPKFGISEMPGIEEQSKVWKENYNNAMRLIKAGGGERNRFFYGGQQYLNQQPKYAPQMQQMQQPHLLQQPILQQPIPQMQQMQQPHLLQQPILQQSIHVTEFIEVKTEEGSKFLDLKSSNQIPIMPITYKTYETFPQEQHASTLLVPQKQPFVNTMDQSTETINPDQAETKKEPFTQKVKDVFKKIINKPGEKSV